MQALPTPPLSATNNQHRYSTQQIFQFPPGMQQQQIQIPPAQQQQHSRPPSAHQQYMYPPQPPQGYQPRQHHTQQPVSAPATAATTSQQSQPATPTSVPVQPAMRQALIDADNLLTSTRTGLTGLYDALLQKVTKELQGRFEELMDAKEMNARIERDYRDLYRLAIHLQRRVEQNKGEIEMLRLRKGADGAAIVEAYGKVREREDMLWGAVDRCLKTCTCNAARKTLSTIVQLPRASILRLPQQQQPAPTTSHNQHPQPAHNQHRRDSSAHSHVSAHSHASTSAHRHSSTSAHTHTSAAHSHSHVSPDQHQHHRHTAAQDPGRRFSTGSTTSAAGSPVVTGPHSAFQSPVVQAGPSGFHSPVVPSGPSAFQSPGATAFQSPTAGAFQLPVAIANAYQSTTAGLYPVFNGQPVHPNGTFNHGPGPVTPVVPSQMGMQPPTSNPQSMASNHNPQPPATSSPNPQAMVSNSQAQARLQPQNKQQLTPGKMVMALAHQRLQTQATMTPYAAQAQAQRQVQSPAQASSSSSTVEQQQVKWGDIERQAYSSLDSEQQTQGQASTSTAAESVEPSTPSPNQSWPSLSKAARVALIALGDSNSPLRDALRVRAGSDEQSSSSAPHPNRNPPSSLSDADVRARLYVKLMTRLQSLPPTSARTLLNLTQAEYAALAALGVGDGGGDGGTVRLAKEHGAALVGLGKDKSSAVAELINAVCVGQSEEVKDGVVKTEVIDLTQEEEEAVKVEDQTADRMDVDRVASASRSGSERVQDPNPQPQDIEDSPSRRRARSDSGVGTDISDASGSGEGPSDSDARASKRARMSIDEGDGREIQQTLTPDATPRLRAAVPMGSLPDTMMVERESAPEDQGSIDPRALTSAPDLAASATGDSSQMEMILGALRQAGSVSEIADATTPRTDAAPPPQTPTPATTLPSSASAPPPVERTRSVPTAPAVPASAPATPAEPRVFTPSPFVQAGYNGPYADPPPPPQHPYEQMGISAGPSLGQGQAGMETLPHVPADMEDGGELELPRLPDVAGERVLGAGHLALAFVMDGSVGGWVCRLCLQRKEEEDPTFPVPVYQDEYGGMSENIRPVMSAHYAQTHTSAYSYIANLSEDEARIELMDMEG